MQVYPWILAGSLAGSLVLSGCYDDSVYHDLVELQAETGDTDSDAGSGTGSGAGGSATGVSGVTITDGSPQDTDSDTDGEATDGAGAPGGAPGEGLGADLPPLISALRIDGEAGDGAVFKGVRTALLEVDASDDRSLESVTFSVDDVPVVTLTQPPYRYAWVIDDVIASSAHTLRAEARDDSDQSSHCVAKVTFDLPPGGSELWNDPGLPFYAGSVDDLALSPKGSVIAAGSRSLDNESPLAQAVVRIVSPLSGGLELDVAYPKDDVDGAYRARAVGMMEDGRIAAGGSFIAADDPMKRPRPWLAIFSASGMPLAVKLWKGERGEIRDLAVVDDDVIITGDRIKAGASQAWIARADGELALDWERILEVPGSEWSSSRALALADDGALYIAGTTFDGVTPRVLAASIGDGGLPLWSGPVPALGEGGDFGEALAISADGKLLIGGAVNYEDGQQMSLRWLHPESGETSGDFTIPSVVDGDQRVMGVTVDHLGRVYVTANITGTDDDVNVVVYKRSIDGGASHWEQLYDSGDDLYDQGSAITVDPHGYVYAGGSRSAQGWPRWWVQGHNP